RDLLKLLVDRIEIHRDEVRLVYKVPQNPFVLSPASRGFLQHCLSRQVLALGFSPRYGNHRAPPVAKRRQERTSKVDFESPTDLRSHRMYSARSLIAGLWICHAFRMGNALAANRWC
ncbi:MAG: hypothetical protein NXI32_24955, partial [bacterium]|nr:hypothetical protein [bacterium]